jgi:PadR family transcriptional regulator, regulatory protein AphA
MSRLSATARVILGLLAFQPTTGYDIKRVTDFSTRFFWRASYGQIYPELRGLEEAGLVRSRDEPRGRRPRRVYELTRKGRDALEGWLAGESELYELRDEGLLKLFLGDLLREDERLALVRRRRADWENSASHFRGIAVELGEVEGPSAEVLRYGIEFADWQAAWWADLEERLGERSGGQADA